MSEGNSLDDILSGAPAVEAPEAVVIESPEPETIGQPRDENGRFAPKEAGETEPVIEPVIAAPPAAEPGHIPREALMDERRKRQELERRLQQMEAQFNKPAQPQQPTDFWEDPNSFLDQFGSKLLRDWEQRQAAVAADRAEQAARAKYPDYDDAFAQFATQVQLNPSLVEELQRSSDPAEFAYKRGKQALELQSVGDLDTLKERIRAETRAEYEAELRAAAPRPAAPLTLAADRSAAVARTGPTWAGPQPIGDILGR